MTVLLVAAGALVALGAGVATGARSARAASVGALACLVFAPFVADPLPDFPVALFRIVAGVLAAFLLLVDGPPGRRGIRVPAGPAGDARGGGRRLRRRAWRDRRGPPLVRAERGRGRPGWPASRSPCLP